jgi:MoaA/NifB/PqqE/SkfB family radical SAM enzyme
MFKEINLPINTKLDVESNSKVVRVDSLKNIVSFKSQIDKTIGFYSRNTKVLYFYLSDFSLLKTLNNLRYKNLNIIFDLNIKNITLLKEYKEFIKNFNLTAILDSGVKHQEIVSVVKFLSFLGVKSFVTYDLFKTIDEKEMKNITKEIVLNPEFVKDVEPFFSFVNYVYKKKIKKEIDESLWSSFKDKLEEFSYITSDGFVTVSKRWDKRSRYLYNLDEPKERRHESELYKELDSYEQNLFFKNLECAMCESFEYCGAYLKFEDGKYNCTPFQTMLKEIDENFDIFKVSKAA